MKKLLYLLLLIPALGQAEGPRFRHKEPATEQEVHNIYQDIRAINSKTSTLTVTTSSTCIDFPTFCVDTTNNRVGIGTTTPSAGYMLDIQRRTAGDSAQLRLAGDTGASDGGAGIVFAHGLTTKWSMFSRNVAGNAHSWALSTGEGDYNASVLKATASGEILQPLQPSFLVTNSAGATDQTGDGTVYTIPWETEVFDQGGDFASNTFTAPVSGRYFLTVTIRILGVLSTHTTRVLSIVTSNRTYNTGTNHSLAETAHTLVLSAVADMDANDTVTVSVVVANSTKVIDLNADATFNYFSGSLIN